MARNPNWFDQSSVSVIVDNKLVQGFMSGDAVRINPNAEGSTMDVGLDNATTTFTPPSDRAASSTDISERNVLAAVASTGSPGGSRPRW